MKGEGKYCLSFFKGGGGGLKNRTEGRYGVEEQVKILFVDDEKNVLKSLERVFLDDDYEIITATSGSEGLNVLEKNPHIQLIISDYRMPGVNGVDFLRKVYERWPDTVRIVLSGYADTAAVVSAINEGRIYKFIPKPWNDDELKGTISNAIERYFLAQKNHQLTRTIADRNIELEKLNGNLEKMVSERTSELMFQNNVLARSQNILDALPIAVLGIDPDGLVVQCNRKGIELLNRGEASIIGEDRINILTKEMNDFVDRVGKKESFSGYFSIGNTEIESKGALMEQDDHGQEGIVLVFCERCEEKA